MSLFRWLIIGLFPLVGCATWSAPEDEPLGLPGPRMTPDSVVLEMTFVQLPLEESTEADLWLQVDEQHLPLETSRRLHENGIRTGLVGSQFPEALHRLLDKPGPNEMIVAGMSPAETELFAQQKRLQIRAGESHAVVVAPQQTGEMVVLLSEEGSISAHRFSDAKGFLSITSTPLGDGRVRVELTPEIEHGHLRQRISGVRGSWLVTNSRERRVFDELRFSTVMSAGQTLMITCTPELKGLGDQLLVTGESATRARTLMLIRLAQTQIDDLFVADEWQATAE
jgi:hypothetical protein